MLSAAEAYEQVAQWVVRLQALSSQGETGVGSGFITSGKLVTCGHNILKSPDWNLLIFFHELFGEFQTMLTESPHSLLDGFSEEGSFDYAILRPFTDPTMFPGLELAKRPAKVGEPVAAFGYHLDDPTLTVHQGIVSAITKSGPATMLKLDLSINAGNSGGPLVALEDGKVLGVVARKATGLSQTFKKLIEVIEGNIATLQAANSPTYLVASPTVGGIDQKQALIAQQHLLKHLAKEIERSANVGIGYAVYVDPLREEAALS